MFDIRGSVTRTALPCSCVSAPCGSPTSRRCFALPRPRVPVLRVIAKNLDNPTVPQHRNFIRLQALSEFTQFQNYDIRGSPETDCVFTAIFHVRQCRLLIDTGKRLKYA